MPENAQQVGREVMRWINEQPTNPNARGRILLLDGAFGSILYARGVPKNEHFLFPWSVEGLVWDAQPAIDLHADYIAAGCDVITTNAFRTTPIDLERTFEERMGKAIHRDLLTSELSESLAQITRNWGSVSDTLTGFAKFLAHAARDAVQSPREHPADPRVAIAGNLTTFHDCYKPERVPRSNKKMKELREAHSRKISALTKATNGPGVDIVLIETVNTMREACLAAEVALEETDVPVWISLIPACTTDIRREASRLAHLDPVACNPKTARRHLYTPYATDAGHEKAKEAVGDNLKMTVNKLSKLEKNGRRVEAVLFNCAPMHDVLDAVAIARQELGDSIPIGAYPNTETKGKDGYHRDREITEHVFAKWCGAFADQGARIIGGCCGTKPRDLMCATSLLEDPRRPGKPYELRRRPFDRNRE